MNRSADSLEGIYYDGQQPAGVPATLTFSVSGVGLTEAQTTRQYLRNSLYVSPRIAQADRFINLPEGAQFQCHDSVLLDRLPQEKSEGLIAWLENRVIVALLGIALVVALVGGYFYGLPRLADYVVARLPMETERVIGDRGLEFMDEHGLQPSTLSEETRNQIRAGFDALKAGLPQEANYRLEFRNAPTMGPNAFALPGGTIVLTDGLVKLAESQNEIAAVLAHEIGHIEYRHTLRLILQNSAVLMVAATVVGDAATLGVAGVPAVLAQAQYSRSFEAQADDFAFKLLKEHGISPNSFADIMLHMAKHNGDTKSPTLIGFLSTHPLTQERIERARAAAGDDPAAPN